ncbi:FadR/GntR family transcriptional regulator [Chelatococcus sp. GCM10030263]|uniref:FadR/GntR family transcriptional regulator n=1 Tax=Chelatococcus sp. GCM10030263 TaxID=3273387 RepID=UPI00360A1683
MKGVGVQKRPNSHSGRAPRYRHAEAAVTIGRRIVGGEWQPGRALPPEEALSRELTVSRSSLREAIKLLAGKGLVHSAPRRGTVVRALVDWNLLDADVLSWHSEGGLSAAFVRGLFELRGMIEPEAAGLAAERGDAHSHAEIAAAMAAMAAAEAQSSSSVEADLAFHRAVLVASHNPFLAALAPAIEASLSLSFRASRRAGNLDHLVPLHAAVAEAILARKGSAARDAMRRLLVLSERDAMSAVTTGFEEEARDGGDGGDKATDEVAAGTPQ